MIASHRPYRIVKFGPEPKRFKKFLPKQKLKQEVLIVGDGNRDLHRDFNMALIALANIKLPEVVLPPMVFPIEAARMPDIEPMGEELRIEKAERKQARKRQFQEWRKK